MVPREGGFTFGCFLFTRVAGLQLVPIGTCFILYLTGEKLLFLILPGVSWGRLPVHSVMHGGTLFTAVTSGTPTLPFQNYGVSYHLARSRLNPLSAAIYYPFIVYSFDFVHIYMLLENWFIYVCLAPHQLYFSYIVASAWLLNLLLMDV